MQSVGDLDARSREILRLVVEAYVETGEPVGSRTLSRMMNTSASPATVRNSMADLETLGLLYSPHTSSGRMPTDLGLRMFVSGLLEMGRLTPEERSEVDARCKVTGGNPEKVLEQATVMLSGLSNCAGLVWAPKSESPLRHIEFVHLGPGRALVVMVTENGEVENRLVEIPAGLPLSVLRQAGDYLSSRLCGRTLSQSRATILKEIKEHRSELDELTAKLVRSGLATASSDSGEEGVLIVRGQSRLLSVVQVVEDLDRVRYLFDVLEGRENMMRLLDLVHDGDGVQIFIGSENRLFKDANCSMIIAPYQNSREQIVGAIGVIGPTRVNYARVIPLVDYTAKVIGCIL